MNNFKFLNSILIVIFSSILQFAEAQTNVSGGIYTNTTWTLANSPYNVVSDVAVFPNVNLTIEPGVVVEFQNNTKLWIKGELIAIGTVTDSIIFTSASQNPVVNSWVGIKLSSGASLSSVAKYCVFEYAHYAVDMVLGAGGFIVIENSTFSNNERGIDDSNSTLRVENCLFKNHDFGIFHGFYSDINNSKFINNNFGLKNCSHVSVDNSSFCSNGTGIEISEGSVTNCLIQYNNTGMYAYVPVNQTMIINSNTVINNMVGLKLGSVDLGAGNTICNNSVYNIENINGGSFDVSDNCWCTTNINDIEAKIYDGYDNINLGLATYMPITICDSTAAPILYGCSINDTSFQQINLNWLESDCFSDCNGTISVLPYGGAPPYSYQWINLSSTSAIVSGLCEGVYSVIVTDFYGSTDTITYTAGQLPSSNLGCFNGIDSNTPINSWSLSPNPISESAILSFENQSYENLSLIIYNLMGQPVKIINNIQTNKILIHKENLSTGLYIFELKNNNSNIISGKIIFE